MLWRGLLWVILLSAPTRFHLTPFSYAYQQVYAATAFPEALNITSLTFYNDIADQDTAIAPGTYRMSLSTTNKAINGLNTLDLDANVGVDNPLVATLVATDPISVPEGTDFLLVLSSPFMYDPANGNLLLDIFTSMTTIVDGVFRRPRWKNYRVKSCDGVCRCRL